MSETCDIGGGVRLAYSRQGSGPLLVLMHGAEGNHHMFDALAAQLAAHFTVIAYDQRDCGQTQNPAQAVSLADLADDTLALISGLGHPKAFVYGTSFGGRVAQALVHRHPAAVDRLVLGSTWPLPLALESLNPDGVREIQALRAGLPASAAALAEYFFPQPFLAARPELRNLFRDAQPQSARSLRRFRTVSEHPLLAPHDIRVPALVIAGELDRVVPPAATMAMASQMPDAERLLLPDVGHAGALQVPALIAEHIRRFCLQARATHQEATA